MREENKIHYDWFKKNQKFFKREFRDYVNNVLNCINMSPGTVEDLDRVYPLMQSQFPANELKSKEKLAGLIADKKYILYVTKNKIHDTEENKIHNTEEIIAYAFVYVLNNHKAIWLDYLAVSDKYQDKGYGTLLFDHVMSTVGGGDYDVFLEVDIPENKNDRSAPENRRIRFYEKLGAKKVLGLKYSLPTEKGSMPLYLYFRPNRNADFIDKELFTGVINEVMGNVHSDLPSMPQVRDEVIKNINTADIKL